MLEFVQHHHCYS